MKKLIINADDFGLNENVNEAIMAAMDSKLCLDTTLLVNFENSENAAKLAISTNRKENIGIHLNLTEGFPISSRIRNESRFCNANGLFLTKKDEHILQLTKSEKIAVREEITAQIHLCRKFGISISHADSHNHIHEEPGLFLLLLEVLKNEKVPFLRLTNNLGKTAFSTYLYRSSYNTILSLKNLTGTDYFGSVRNLVDYANAIKENSIIELMIHPGKVIENQIYDVYSKENLSILLPEIIRDYKLISYSQIKE